MDEALRRRLREVLSERAGLARPIDDITDDQNLFEAGMTSFATVDVMLGLEDAFDLDFPDSLLRANAFGSVVEIAEALRSLGVPI